MKKLATLTQAERVAAILPFVGRVCRVTYRGGRSSSYDRDIRGYVVGASWHATNGNSTGDLVLVPRLPGHIWTRSDAEWQAQSIALAHVGDIVVEES